MSFPQGWELVLIVLVIVLLFGARKLPDAARGIGRSLRIFKAEVGSDDKDRVDEDDKVAPPAATAQTPPPPAITPGPVVVTQLPPAMNGAGAPIPAPVEQPVVLPSPTDQKPAER